MFFQLIGLSLKVNTLRELEYRVNFFLQIIQSALSLVIGIGGIAIIFEHTDTLNGWSANQLLIVIGVYTLIGGVIGFIIRPSFQKLMEDVRMGTLDFTLLKPHDAQFMASIKQFAIWHILDVLLGLGIVTFGMIQSATIVTMGQLLIFLLMLVAGMTIIYSFWLILASTVFWLVKVDNILFIFESMYEAGRYPVTIYPGWLQFMLTFLVPIAFAITIPAQAIIGQLPIESALLAIGIALVAFILARLVWLTGLRHYSGASA
ncbi:MAG: ABC-2 family transporter protein [Anaerolineae bacterium]|nr:ABC-2 family transporter protein [Anaerolineae bacterium]